MSRVRITPGKFAGIQACADSNGIIAAAAMDQRGSLRKAIAAARGSDVPDADLTEFKTLITRVLTKHSSAILMDPEFGLPALEQKAPGTGVLLAYEKTGYDANVKGRLPDLLPEWSVQRLKAAGADAIKILLYYNPFDDARITTTKHAFIQRIGDECKANDIAFFLEPICYDDNVGPEGSFEFAQVKPQYVIAYMREFSKPEYGVDVLKVEVPVNVKFTAGMAVFNGKQAYTREQAKDFFREAAAATNLPFIYLSAGVSDDVFRETLELAAEAGTPFSGVLCGRATWQDGVPIYGKQGAAALEAWLEDRGVANINALNETLAKGARPWWTVYGGLDAIDVH